MIHWMHTGQWPCYIGFTTSSEAFDKCMKRMKVHDAGPWIIPGSHATTHELVKSDGQMTLLICINRPSRKQSKEQYAALVAHEALHVVQAVEERFYNRDRMDRENASYLLQYIVQHCLQHAWVTNRTRKTKP